MDERTIDVDGETVTFAIRSSGQGQAINRLPVGLPPTADHLSGRGATLRASLESPPSRKRIEDYGDDELRALWRARVAKARE